MIPADQIAALSLRQPYAGLVAAGLKTIETRTRRTHHRGELLICAASRVDEDAWMRLLPRIPPEEHGLCSKRAVALAVVEVVGCRPLQPEDERAAWFYAWGRWAWELDRIRPVKPFHVRGRQGFFCVPAERVRRALEPPCSGFGGGGAACCDKAGEYSGFGSDGPRRFQCPRDCACHD